MNNKGQVKPETKVLIEKVISDLGYIPSSIAQNLRSKRSGLLGVVIPDFTYYYSEILNHIEVAAKPNGFSVIVLSTEKDKDRERECIMTLMQRGVEGLILFSYAEDADGSQLLDSLYRKIPIVLMDYQTSLPISCIYTDGYIGIKKVTSSFIKQKRKKIAIISEDTRYGAHNRRLQGYLDAFQESGMEINPDYIINTDMSLDSGYKAAEQLLNREDPPQAIINISDNTAISVLKYCYDNGINVPNDVEVTGFDGIDLSNYTCPSLTTVKQPIKEMAESAIGIINRKLENPKFQSKNIVFQPEYILQHSTLLDSIE
jgi:LacI family repressor for deo operon, udp, cdd, tsx, nupC, and nupG